MKICSRCKESKELDCFGKMTKAKDGLQAMCKPCKAADHQANRETRLPSITASKARRVAVARRWVYDYLLANSCPCGEGNPILLDFDHLDPSFKSHDVSYMVSHGYSLKTIQAEIAKCRVLCVKCHRLWTAEQHGWWIHRVNAYIKAGPSIKFTLNGVDYPDAVLHLHVPE